MTTKKWSNLITFYFLISTFLLMTSKAQINPYQQRYQYGNNNINNGMLLQNQHTQQQQQQQQAQQLHQPSRQFGSAAANNNNQRYSQTGQSQQGYPNQQQNQQQQYYQQQGQQNQQYGQQQNNMGNGMNQYGQQQSQFGQNQSNRNSGAGAGLLGNPIRTSNSAFGNSSSADGRALFGIRIVSYSLGRADATCAVTACSYSFSIVMATLEATVNYESSNFFPLNGSTLQDGNWRDQLYLNISTKPISVDIFVHSRGLTIGNVDGNYSLGVPVQHVNTFVLDLRSYIPFGSNASMNPTTIDLQDSKPNSQAGGSIRLEYFVQCLNGFMGPNCDYTCIKTGTNIAQCTSVINPNEKHSCKYDNGFTQIIKDSCDYCSQGFSNNGTCVPIGYSSNTTCVAHAYKIWTIVLAVLLAIALLIILLLVMLKLIMDSRNRRAQQFPQNRQQSAYSGGYRPNAGSGDTPLLGGTDKEWERERQQQPQVPAIIRRPPIAAHANDVDSTQESFQDNHRNGGGGVGGHYSATQPQSRRHEAQV